MYILLVLQIAFINPNAYTWSQVGIFETEKQCVAVAEFVLKQAKEEIKTILCVPTRETGIKL